MNVVIIPLGLIVDTKIERSLAAFSMLFTALKLGIKLDQAFTDSLQEKFKAFNLGAYADAAAFGADLLAFVKSKIAPNNTEIHPDWELSWRGNWLDCWNAQCEINDQSATLLNLILETNDVDFVLVSETNIAHAEHIFLELQRLGVDLKALNRQFSFEKAMLAEVMMANIAVATAQAGKRCARLKGSLENIHPNFRAAAAAKETIIQEAVSRYAVDAYDIPDPQLPVDKLKSIISTTRCLSALADVAPTRLGRVTPDFL